MTNHHHRHPQTRLRQEQHSHQQRDRDGNVWQKNMALGWTYMSLYWIVGALVGWYFGYWECLLWWNGNDNDNASENSSGNQILKYAFGTMVTLICQPILLKRFGSYGRKVDWKAVVIFSIGNGTCETMLFLAAYDTGKCMMRKMFGLSSSRLAAQWMGGFFVYNVYAALIHVHFWLPRGFPRHVVPNAPPFRTTALPALVAMSAAWLLVLYERDTSPFHAVSIRAVVMLHAMMNSLFTVRIALPLPTPLLRRWKNHQQKQPVSRPTSQQS